MEGILSIFRIAWLFSYIFVLGFTLYHSANDSQPAELLYICWAILFVGALGGLAWLKEVNNQRKSVHRITGVVYDHVSLGYEIYDLLNRDDPPREGSMIDWGKYNYLGVFAGSVTPQELYDFLLPDREEFLSDWPKLKEELEQANYISSLMSQVSGYKQRDARG